MTSFASYNFPPGGDTDFTKFPRLEPFLLFFLVLLYFTWKLILPKGNSRLSLSMRSGKSMDKILNIPKLKHFRFPVNIPYIDGLITIYRIRRDGVRIVADWFSQHGRLIEWSFGSLKGYGVTDPAIIQKILLSSNPVHMNKPQYLYGKVFAEWLREGIINSDYNLWHGRRKMVARSFTYKSLQSYVKLMNSHSKNLVQDFWEHCSNEDGHVAGEKVWHSLHFHAIKIIGQIAMGADRFSDTDTENFYKNFIGFKRIITERVMNPLLFIPLYWHFHPIKKEFTGIVNNCQTFFDKMIGTYRREFEDKKSMTNPENHMQSATQEDDMGEKPFRCLLEEMLQCGATDEEICSEFATFIMAGHETTVTALQFLMVHLALNPVHLKTCQEEVDKLMESKQTMILDDTTLSTDADIVLDMDDLSSLEYLKRCIMESNRIHPALPVFVRRLDGPLQVCENLTFPANSTILMSPYVSHRDPDYFPDPETFDPDRFLPEKTKERHPFAYIPFSSGSRNCIGYKMAMMEMKIVMAWLLYHFDITTTDKIEDVKLFFQVTLMPERNYNVILKRRRKNM